MKKAISNSAAIAFAAEFYEGLGFERSMQTAFDLGLNALLTWSIPEEDNPTLLMQNGLDPTKFYPVNPS